MDRDPEEIKSEIEETRSRMGDTVEALAYKTDVRARARDAVSDRIDAIKGKVSDAATGARAKAHDARDAMAQLGDRLPSADQAREGLRQARWLAEAGCEAAQGFLFSKGLPYEQFVDWMALHSKSLPRSG